MEEIFIKGLTKREKGNPSSINNLAKIPGREGYIKGYKPYGEKGRGYYYIKIDKAENNNEDM